MANIIALNKSLDIAIDEAIKSAEIGDFERTIVLMDYVKKYKNNFDEVMVNYFLLYSHFALGNLVEAKNQLDELDSLQINNEQINVVINEIRNELISSVNVEEIDEYIITLYNRCEKLNVFNPDRQGYFLEMLYNKDQKNAYNTLKEMYEEALDVISFLDKTKAIDNLQYNLTQLDTKMTLQVLNRLLINGFFWELITKEQFEDMLNNEHVDDVVKQLMICIAINYSRYTKTDKYVIKEICKVNIKEQKIDMLHIFDCADYVDRILNNTKNLTWSKIVDVILIFMGTNKFYDSTKLFTDKSVATICYALNELYILDVSEIIIKNVESEYEDVKLNVKAIVEYLKV